MAIAAGWATLVATHFMPEITDELDAAVAEIRRVYDGHVVLASDLLTVPLSTVP